MFKKCLFITIGIEALGVLLSFAPGSGPMKILSIFGFWLHGPGLTFVSFAGRWIPSPVDFLAAICIANVVLVLFFTIGVASIRLRGSKHIQQLIFVACLGAFVTGVAVSSFLILKARTLEPTPPRYDRTQADEVKKQFDRLCPVASLDEDFSCDVWAISGFPPSGPGFVIQSGITNGLTYLSGIGTILLVALAPATFIRKKERQISHEK